MYSVRDFNGKKLEKEVIEIFDFYSVNYQLNGYEKIFTKEVVSEIKRSHDDYSMSQRMRPDFIVFKNGKVNYLEVKNSSGFPKSSYDYLMAHYDLDNLWFCNRNKDVTLVRDIKFEIPKEIEPIAKIKIPIVDNYWRSPDLLSSEEQKKYRDSHLKYKGYYPSMYAFAFIDFSNTAWTPLDKWITQ